MSTIKIIPESEQRHRTWKEICMDFPNLRIAIKDPDNTLTMNTGGIVVAHSIDGISESEGELFIYARKNGYYFTDTFPERGVLMLW